MRKILLLFLLLLTVASSFGQQLAFPGAVGFGRYATGGRNGTVYKVTNLNDNGPGSLREAVSQPNRIVVFEVAGIINIESRLIFSKNLTIAGQTAPGEGIVVYGNGVSFSGANNIIVRNMAFRMGIGGDSGKDAAGIANGSNMIFDHVSVTWGRDETFSVSWDNKGTEPTNITIQNSIIGQGLLSHSAGGLVQTNGGVSLIRNLYIDNHTRNPKVKGLNQFVNNVVYNWGGGGCYILGDSEGTSWATIVNNYFINGPSASSTPYSRANENFQLYARGNYHDSNKNGLLDGVLSIQPDYGPAFWVESPDYWDEIPESDVNKIPQKHPDIPILMTANEAYSWIVDSVGKILPARDEVDTYLINQLTSLGTLGATISSENELPTNGPGKIYRGPVLTDSDNDGIPDEWEVILGTNSAVDDAMIAGEDGYTNIERYINSISTATPFLKYPVAITAKALTTSSITLKWDDEETETHEIIIEISDDNTAFTEVARIDQTSDSYKTENLQSGTTYYFRLKSVGSTKTSAYSDVYSIATQGEATAPFTSVNPIPADSEPKVNYRNLTLEWTNNTNVLGGALYFNVYMGLSQDDLSLLAENIAGRSLLVESLDPGTTYYWQVKATNVLGESLSDIWHFTTAEMVERELLLHLPFDETSGTGAVDLITNNMAESVGFTPQWASGKIANAIYFPGTPTASYLRFPHNENIWLNDQSFTITLWFKSPGNIADSYLFHKGMHDAVNGGNGKWIGIQYKSNILTFAIDDNANKSNLDIANANQWFNDEWHHLACVRNKDDNKLLVYIDGMPVGSRSDITTGGVGVTTDLILGNCDGYYNTPFPGNMDDVRIYSSALSSDEIHDLHAGTATSIINPVTDKSNISLFPNPFSDFVYIAIGPAITQSKATVQIYDLAGSLVFDKTCSITNNQIVLKHLHQLPRGLYTCVVKLDNNVFTVKILH
ncbi:LamG-like jellyroll fold domain-containing protein [Geofilum sp. OHC36d9]|uniref:LamG-like jellyroll fold domain-containing protein n=1 Tax=Geofilum sp. OHC36d9 TaxID=3458413 RepID=UPI00403485C8